MTPWKARSPSATAAARMEADGDARRQGHPKMAAAAAQATQRSIACDVLVGEAKTELVPTRFERVRVSPTDVSGHGTTVPKAILRPSP